MNSNPNQEKSDGKNSIMSKIKSNIKEDFYNLPQLKIDTLPLDKLITKIESTGFEHIQDHVLHYSTKEVVGHFGFILKQRNNKNWLMYKRVSDSGLDYAIINEAKDFIIKTGSENSGHQKIFELKNFTNFLLNYSKKEDELHHETPLLSSDLSYFSVAGGFVGGCLGYLVPNIDAILTNAGPDMDLKSIGAGIIGMGLGLLAYRGIIIRQHNKALRIMNETKSLINDNNYLVGLDALKYIDNN